MEGEKKYMEERSESGRRKSLTITLYPVELEIIKKMRELGYPPISGLIREWIRREGERLGK